MPPPPVPFRPSVPATPVVATAVQSLGTPTKPAPRSLKRNTVLACDWCDKKFDSEELEAEEVGSRIFQCCTCAKYYHEPCLQVTETTASKIWSQKDQWQCMDCKHCVVCSSSGGEDKLLICDDCDRGFHTYCLQPPLARPPPGSWRCDDCVHCDSCGAEVPGPGPTAKWRKDYSMCEACWALFKKDRFCPVCEKVYKPHDTTPMISCDQCEKWLHVKCDKSLNKKLFEAYTDDESLKYWCPECKEKNGQLMIAAEPDPPSEEEVDNTPEMVLDKTWLLERLAQEDIESTAKRQKLDETTQQKCFFCQEADSQPVQGILEPCEGFKSIYVHKNCIEWAARLPVNPSFLTLIQTETDGDVIHRARKGKLLCGRKGCGIRGASIGCFNANCPKSYHFKCALMIEGVFTGRPRKFEFYCPQHQ